MSSSLNGSITVVFMGTPDFAVPSLLGLLEDGYRVAAVVTQPDRPKGRKRVLTPPPVKVIAEERGIPVFQPERLRRSDTVQRIAELKPDFIVTAAYGQILPKEVLDAPRLGCINVHGSLLPKYRGGAPIQRAIMNGEPVTGVTIMYMAEGIDTGDMISKVEVPITDGDNAGTIFDKLSIAGADLLRHTLPDILAGRVTAVPQNHGEATIAPNIKREDERIEWNRSASDIFNQIRGLSPWPVAFTTWNGENFKIWAARKPEASGGSNGASSVHVPGTVLAVTDEGIEVAAGSGTIWLTEVQPAGKKALKVAEFRRGAPMEPGTVLGQ